MSKKDKLSWIYSSKDTKELTERYDEWAQSYDRDLEEDYGYQIPRVISETLSRFAAKDSRVLDAGAGTGLVGQFLRGMGYEDLVAVDISGEMLNQAREKGVYKEFYQMDLGEALDFADDSFDAVVCAGVLTFSHAPARSLYELARITKPGGHVLYSLRDDAVESLGIEAVNSGLESDGKWELVEKQGHQSFQLKEPDVIHDIWVYEVL